jgi:hypothetical protein
MSKAEAAAHLATNITDSNRGAVAKALGVSNGPNLQNRITQAIKTMASKPGTSVIIPATIGYSVYDAMRTPAEAGEGEEISEPMSRPAAAAAGTGAAAATGGAIAGGKALASRLASGPLGSALRTTGRVAGRVAGPVGLGLAAYDVANIIAAGATPAPANDAFAEQYARTHPRFDPEAIKAERMQARQAMRTPMENPAPPEAPPMPLAETPSPSDGMSEFDQLVMASEQDPELAAMLRDAILARVQQANEQQIPNAMASQAVASRGSDPMAMALRNFAQR